MIKRKEKISNLKKKYNTLELKYLALLEEYNEELKKKVTSFEEIENLKILCKIQKAIIKELKK